MEIVSIESFLSYYEKIRVVTRSVVDLIPRERLDWSYMPGKFTIGDLVRHIAAIERYVFAEIALGNRPTYQGCGKELVDGYENVVSYFDRLHLQSVAIFRSLPLDALARKVRSVDGKDVVLRNFLRALIVHEVHHRGALIIYLNLLGVKTPPVLGLMEEEVRMFSKES